MQKTILKLQDKRTHSILKVQSAILKAVADHMYEKGVTQLMPIMLSPITDTLNHDVDEAEIEYCGQKLKLTKSMILHKQLALMSEHRKSIFIVSPNIRLEREHCKDSGRHLFEFSQVDFEFKDKSKEEVMAFMEDLFAEIITKVKEDCKEELEYFGRDIKIPLKPFKVYESKKLKAEYGDDFEKIVSKMEKRPFWILDHEREFYDKEHPKKSKYYLNFDLVYPEGYGEGLSGAEREHEYEQILDRMKRAKVDPKDYKQYIELAKRKLLPRTAGAGFGVERLVRYLCGLDHIEDAALFPRTPGKEVIF